MEKKNQFKTFQDLGKHPVEVLWVMQNMLNSVRHVS